MLMNIELDDVREIYLMTSLAAVKEIDCHTILSKDVDGNAVK